MEIDDFCKSLPVIARPGPIASLSRSEVLTLAVFGQWRHFSSERSFYRWAQRHLHSTFPTMPDQSQFNRLQRLHYLDLVAFWQHITHALRPDDTSLYYEAMDATAVATRYVRRRGRGWLPQANVAIGSRIGWYCGFYLLATTDPNGVFTGFCFGPASTKDQPLATAFLAARANPHPRLPTVGNPLPEDTFYLTDSGFQGADLHRQWRQEFGAEVITPPQRGGGWHPRPWILPWRRGLRRWIASLRQIIETAFQKLHHDFRLRDERPHTIEGFMTRLTAKFTLHNFAITLNRRLGRPDLRFTDLWTP
jgi:hypothetical protein